MIAAPPIQQDRYEILIQEIESLRKQVALQPTAAAVDCRQHVADTNELPFMQKRQWVLPPCRLLL